MSRFWTWRGDRLRVGYVVKVMYKCAQACPMEEPTVEWKPVSRIFPRAIASSYRLAKERMGKVRCYWTTVLERVQWKASDFLWAVTHEGLLGEEETELEWQQRLHQLPPFSSLALFLPLCGQAGTLACAPMPSQVLTLPVLRAVTSQTFESFLLNGRSGTV